MALVGALGLLGVGCGSGSSSSSSAGSAAPESTAATQGASSTPTQATTTTEASTEQGTQGSSGETSSSSQTPENSIKDYGSAASSADKAALKSAAFSFFSAMANSDYAKLCDSLAASNRKGLQAFLKAKHQSGGCPAILKMLIATRGLPEARKAAAGKLISVGVKVNAFVIFQPKGGKPSYFVMNAKGAPGRRSPWRRGLRSIRWRGEQI